ncbi:X-ray repair cross-complementing protein 5-like isoform X2 [Zophobas morio]|uniref:X-ray repair cross-complementing protein 5-like isoform X2 n=1 Tax=Zophobas morio TaxID=2755281 RepID=UPI0030830724
MSKRAEVICLDVGSTMDIREKDGTNHFELSIKALVLLLEQKLRSLKKNDLTGFVICGTRETSNPLAEDDQYQNIKVLRNLTTLDLELLLTVEHELHLNSLKADILDVVVVALEMLKARIKKLKFEKKILLVTNGYAPTSDLEQLGFIIEELNRNDIEVQILGVDFDEMEEGNELKTNQKSKSPFSRVLKQLAEGTNGEMFSFSTALQLLSKERKQNIRQSPVFRGTLMLGPAFSFPVFAYALTKEAKPPSLKMISTDGNSDVSRVYLQRTYHLLDEDRTEVPKEDCAKGYKYGPTRIPWAKIDEESMKLETEKSLQILSFTKSENVPRRLWMNHVIAFVADPSDVPAQTALSSLAAGLHVTGTVALVRFVRADKATPKVGFLSPHIKKNHSSLLYTELPYADDIRQYQFPSLSFSKKLQPSAEQEQAVAALMASKDLSKPCSEDSSGHSPEHVFNPAIRYFWQCIHQRALDDLKGVKSRNLPAVGSIIKDFMAPFDLVKETSKAQLLNIQELFRLRKIEKRKTDKLGASSYFQSTSKEATEGPPPSKKRPTTEDLPRSIAEVSSAYFYKVGSVNPVADFRTMCSWPEEGLVSEAITQMCQLIEQFVENSYNKDFTLRAFDCLAVLRKECVAKAESFNSWMKKFKEKLLTNRLYNDVWQQIVADGVTLITNDEASDSNVSKEEAEEFLMGTEPHEQLDSGGLAEEELMGLMD